MPVDTFTREQFEAALPVAVEEFKHSASTYCYLLPVRDNLVIYIDSSVDKATNTSRSVGADSIRCYLGIRPEAPLATLPMPLGHKVQKYVTRVPGWPERLRTVLRELYKNGRKAGKCGRCGGWIGEYESKTEANKGRMFWRCLGCSRFVKWSDEQ